MLEAKTRLTTDAAVAEYLGESPQNYAGLKAGRRTLKPVQIARLCELIGMRPEHSRVWLALNAVRNSKSESERRILERALIGTVRDLDAHPRRRHDDHND